MDLPIQIPDALMPVVLGAGLWYGACLVFIAPELTERAVSLHVADECAAGASSALCTCVLEDIRSGSGVFKNALFLFTFSLSDPRVDLFGNSRNPYIEYVSLEARDRKRRDACNAPQLDAIDQASAIARREAEAKAAAERQRLQAQHDAEIERQRAANQKLLDEATDQLKTATDAVKDSPVGQAAADKIEQAKRVYDLQNETSDEVLNWWELAVEKSKSMREKYTRNQQRR